MRRALLLLFLSLAGCTERTELLQTIDAKCTAPGPFVHLGGTDPTACAGALAARFGRYALCSCQSLNLGDELSVMRMHSPHDPPPKPIGPASPGPAAVGSDGKITVAGSALVDGSLRAHGAGGIQIAQGAVIQGSVHSAGPLSVGADGSIGGDAFVAGEVRGRWHLEGALHLPADAMVDSRVDAMHIERAAQAIEAPCGCASGPLFDLGAAVRERKEQNANLALPFSPSLLGNLTQPATLDWPCGEYYLPELRSGASAPLELRVHGRVALFVEGDVHLGANLNVTLDPGAELDLVVAGSLFTGGRLFGCPRSPSHLRVWVAGQTVAVPDGMQFSAIVYAPDAVFLAGDGVNLSGAFSVDTLSLPAHSDLRIAYDPTVAAGGEACGVPAPAPIE